MALTPYYQDEHVTLYHADCRDVLEHVTADVVITDPPYSIGKNGNMLGFMSPNAAKKETHSRGYADHDPDAYRALMVDTFNLIPPTLPPGAPVMFWCGNPTLHQAATAAEHSGLKIIDLIAYTYPPSVAKAQSTLRPGMEIAVLARTPGTPVKFNHDWLAANVRGDGRKTSTRTGHPTEKPLPWLYDAVELLTEPEQTILDPFAGSGTTLRAAKDTNRHAIGVEIEEQYCEIIAKRLAQETLTF